MRSFQSLVLASCLAVLTACPERQIKSFSPAHDQEALGKCAQLFWHALRWGDYEGASALIEQAEPRLDFLTVWSSNPPAQITDFQLVHIELATPSADAERLEGLVVVKVEDISTGTYTVHTEMLRQTWYRAGDTWFLDPDSIPFSQE